MDRRQLLLTTLVVLALSSSFADVTPAFATQGEAIEEGATTDATNNGDSVDINVTIPGSGQALIPDDDGSYVIVGTDTPASSCIRIVNDRCYISLTRPDPAIPGTPTLSDIATFRPTVGTAHMQPNGWGVVGIHTNFYATGDTHTVTGTLLGQPATVRFTPVAYHWDYGDGTTNVTGSPGGTWAHLGIREFAETPGSHRYSTKASYTITLLIEYRAEYQYAGQRWRPIVGSLLPRANDLTVITWNVKTVLVGSDCRENPSAPGC